MSYVNPGLAKNVFLFDRQPLWIGIELCCQKCGSFELTAFVESYFHIVSEVLNYFLAFTNTIP